MPIPLVVIESPYRTYAGPSRDFIKQYRETHGSSVVTVYLPQYIVGHWWESLLHNRRARRIGQQLMLVHGVTITLVPWLLDSSELIYGRRSRPLPGQERAGRPFEATTNVAVVEKSSLERPDPTAPRGVASTAEPSRGIPCTTAETRRTRRATRRVAHSSTHGAPSTASPRSLEG